MLTNSALPSARLPPLERGKKKGGEAAAKSERKMKGGREDVPWVVGDKIRCGQARDLFGVRIVKECEEPWSRIHKFRPTERVFCVSTLSVNDAEKIFSSCADPPRIHRWGPKINLGGVGATGKIFYGRFVTLYIKKRSQNRHIR